MLTNQDSLTVVYGIRHPLFFQGAALTSLRKPYYSSSHDSREPLLPSTRARCSSRFGHVQKVLCRACSSSSIQTLTTGETGLGRGPGPAPRGRTPSETSRLPLRCGLLGLARHPAWAAGQASAGSAQRRSGAAYGGSPTLCGAT